MTAPDPSERPLRILMVCPQFRPTVGGYERAAERLAYGLIESGHRVDVITERRDPAWPAHEEDAGLVIRRLWCVPARGLHLTTSLLSSIVFLLRRARRYDVVHFHQYGRNTGVCIALAHALGRRVVLKLTSTGTGGLDASLPRGGLQTWIRTQHAKVDACVTTSARAAQEARSFGVPADRIHRIPNPLDTANFRTPTADERAAARSQLGIDADFVAISVGRLSPEKNPGMTIDAWTEFAGERADVLLCVLGDGPSMQEIREQVERSAARDSIRILGNVSDTLPWYWSSDLFVLTSLMEGLSNSLMEALSCGLPMLSTRVSGSEDVDEETDAGRIVEQADVADMATALREIDADSDQRAAWSAAARRYALDRYSLASVIDGTVGMYRAILRSNG